MMSFYHPCPPVNCIVSSCLLRDSEIEKCLIVGGLKMGRREGRGEERLVLCLDPALRGGKGSGENWRFLGCAKSAGVRQANQIAALHCTCNLCVTLYETAMDHIACDHSIKALDLLQLWGVYPSQVAPIATMVTLCPLSMCKVT